MVSPSRCPPWQPERPGPTRREPRRAQRSYTTRRDTINLFSYERKIQPMPKLGPWVEELDRQLEANEKKARKDRLSLLRIHEDLASLGYGGGCDAVRRYQPVD